MIPYLGYSTSYLRWQPTTVLPPTPRTSQYRSMYCTVPWYLEYALSAATRSCRQSPSSSAETYSQASESEACRCRAVLIGSCYEGSSRDHTYGHTICCAVWPMRRIQAAVHWRTGSRTSVTDGQCHMDHQQACGLAGAGRSAV